MKIVEGDIIKLAIEGRFDVIIQGCNCFCTMGAGLARSIRHEFPEAYDADCETKKGSKKKLGTCSAAEVEREGARFIVVNAYTQFNYRGYGTKADYYAIRSCMKHIKSMYHGKRIGIPRIGAGLAGGDWEFISEIIAEELHEEDVTLVGYIHER